MIEVHFLHHNINPQNWISYKHHYFSNKFLTLFFLLCKLSYRWHQSNLTLFIFSLLLFCVWEGLRITKSKLLWVQFSVQFSVQLYIKQCCRRLLGFPFLWTIFIQDYKGDLNNSLSVLESLNYNGLLTVWYSNGQTNNVTIYHLNIRQKCLLFKGLSE